MRKDAALRIYGLIGYPVKHSLSALMHNAAFRFHHIQAEYRLFEVKPEDLEDFLLKDIIVRDTGGNSISTGDISGFNITIPHKVRAKEILEKKSSSDDGGVNPETRWGYLVKLSGGINTVKRSGEGFEYYNTDSSGFLKSLKTDLKFEPQGKSAIIIGCGGAGRAIIAALSWAGTGICKIYVNDINPLTVDSARNHFSQFTHLKDKLEFILASEIPGVVKKCDLLVNASPVGMREGDLSVIDRKLIHKDLYVYDCVYNRETSLVREARSSGLMNVSGGLGMLLYQGADAFEIWTDGKAAPIDVMRRALEKGEN